MSENESDNESTQYNINEYYKLKTKYETDNNKNKKKLINSQTLSWNEKRAIFKKIQPKCINCKRAGGTIFSNKYNNQENYRELKAICGVIVDPCKLNITINLGNYERLPDLLKETEQEIRNLKKQVIEDKNNILFGYISTEAALEKFTELKQNISDYSSYFELYLDDYNKIMDNKETKETLNKDVENMYVFIREIKESIHQFNSNNDTQFVRDAVQIYDTNLTPILKKIMKLKYKQNSVWYNEDDNTYHLIQNKYKISDLEIDITTEKVISFVVGA